MYTLGHLGISLTVYAPIAAWYLRAGATELAIAGGAVMLALATVPDMDEYTELISHRGPTHTIWFALAAGMAVGLCTGATIAAASLPFDAIAVSTHLAVLGTLAIVSHLLGDIITPMGIWPYRPLSKRHYSLDLVYAKNASANRLFFGFGLSSTVVSVTATALI